MKHAADWVIPTVICLAVAIFLIGATSVGLFWDSNRGAQWLRRRRLRRLQKRYGVTVEME
jgi:NADH:ubiquinone oxidoreductase subunit H